MPIEQGEVEINGLHFRYSHAPTKDFLRALPSIPLWEGDKVMFSSLERQIQPIELTVIEVDYSQVIPGMRATIPDGYICRVAPDFRQSPLWYAKPNEIHLQDRGNIWKYYHGEQLELDNLTQEARFHTIIGHYSEFSNPLTAANKFISLYSWTTEEVLKFLENKSMHAIMGENGELWISPTDIPPIAGFRTICAVRFDDERLGERVARETLVNFRQS